MPYRRWSPVFKPDDNENDIRALMNHIGMLRATMLKILDTATHEDAKREAKDALAQSIKPA
jgi:FMN-dependent NADH-azoreductase